MAITRQRVGARTWLAAGLLGVVSAEEVASPVEVRPLDGRGRREADTSTRGQVAATVTASAEKGFATGASCGARWTRTAADPFSNAVLKVLEANATDAAPTATSSALGSHSDLLWGLNTTQVRHPSRPTAAL